MKKNLLPIAIVALAVIGIAVYSLVNKSPDKNLTKSVNDGKVTASSSPTSSYSTTIAVPEIKKIRVVTGTSNTYNIEQNDYILILSNTGVATFTIEPPTLANVGREIILANKTGVNQILSQNYFRMDGTPVPTIYMNSTIRLMSDGTNYQLY